MGNFVASPTNNPRFIGSQPGGFLNYNAFQRQSQELNEGNLISSFRLVMLITNLTV